MVWMPSESELGLNRMQKHCEGVVVGVVVVVVGMG